MSKNINKTLKKEGEKMNTWFILVILALLLMLIVISALMVILLILLSPVNKQEGGEGRQGTIRIFKKVERKI